MKTINRLIASSAAVLLSAISVSAQHSDVEFGFNDIANPTSIVFESVSVTLSGIPYFESEMETLDPFDPDDFASDEPGFATGESTPFNEGDQLWLEVLDASSLTPGVGYVNFYNPTTDRLEAGGGISIADNSSQTADLVLTGSAITAGVNPQFVDVASSDGSIHDHVVFDLLNDATAASGAYGLLLQLHSDLAPADGTMDVQSDPFWVIWNYGMDEDAFDSSALSAFGVPEPGSASLMALALAGVLAAGFRSRR